MNITHLMFDIETLGLRETSVVTSLACVPFTFEGSETYDDLIQNSFYVRFSVEDQIKNYKRTTDASTINWWKSQSEEARAMSIKPSPDGVSLLTGIDSLSTFVEQSDYDLRKSYVMSRGNAFDFPKIESLYYSVNIPCAINTFMARDVRTYIDILTGSSNGQYELKNGEPEGFVKHHALHDAAFDVVKMKEIYKLLLEEE